MTKVACGINWTFSEDGVPENGKQFELLAKKLVCDANKFTNLVIYNNGILVPDYTISVDINHPKPSISKNTEDDYAELFIELSDTNENDFCVVVKPDSNLHTSEDR